MISAAGTFKYFSVVPNALGTNDCSWPLRSLGDELGALFDPACGSDSILRVVAQDLFDRRIVLSVGEKGGLFQVPSMVGKTVREWLAINRHFTSNRSRAALWV